MSIFILLSVAMLQPASGQASPASSTPEPIVLFYERNPWLMVIGSDSPIFGLYDTGLVIYAVKDAKDPSESFRSVQLSKTEVQALLKRLKLRELDPYNHQILKVSEYTDQPTNELHYWIEGKPQGTAIYGRLRQGSPERKKVPALLMETVDTIFEFRHEKATFWLPPKIEIMIWDYDYSPEKPLPWPESFPGLDDPATEQRGDSYSLFLENQHFEAFLTMLAKKGERQAFLIDGKKWAISYRFPFP